MFCASGLQAGSQKRCLSVAGLFILHLVGVYASLSEPGAAAEIDQNALTYMLEMATKGAEEEMIAITMAIESQDPALLQALLKDLMPRSIGVKGLSRFRNFDDGRAKEYSILHFAALKNHAMQIPILVAAGMKVDLWNPAGIRALHVAAAHGHAESVIALVKAGADPLWPNDSGMTPATLAARPGHRHVIKALFDLGGDAKESLSKKDTAGPFSPIQYAAHNGHMLLFQYFVFEVGVTQTPAEIIEATKAGGRLTGEHLKDVERMLDPTSDEYWAMHDAYMEGLGETPTLGDQHDEL